VRHYPVRLYETQHQGVHSACPAARNPNQAHHLALELVKAHEVDGVLQHAAVAAVIDRCPEDDALRRLDLPAQTKDIFRVCADLSPIAEREAKRPQVDQPGLGAEFLSTP
jgi:hypothetical protein